MSKYISDNSKELNDEKIIKDLKKTIEMYEDGELIEVVDILNEMAYAINQYCLVGETE